MQSALEFIKEENLINKGEVIGVALSGGSDSMSLLYFLSKHATTLGITLVALHLNHSIRQESDSECEFITQYCKANNIRLIKTKVDVPSYCRERGIGLEQAGRECRYNFFKAIKQKGIVDKVATAHHSSDQAETIMLHLLRGSGLSGAVGMEAKRDFYIRPFLNTSKYEILSYIKANNIPYITDQSNFESDYNRNFLRNEVFPILKKRFPEFERNLCKFGATCKEDSNYIYSQVPTELIENENGVVKIPLSYFIYENSIVSRIILTAIKSLGITQNFEKKHINLIKSLALYAKSGSKLDLPEHVICHKEYDYIALSLKQTKMAIGSTICKPIKIGLTEFENFGTIKVEKANTFNQNNGTHLIDKDKLPKDAVWRYRQTGDTFEKFGGGTKSLKNYLIDKKIPLRLRNYIPVLASGNKILLIAGVEISNSVKVDDNTKTIYKITINKL